MKYKITVSSTFIRQFRKLDKQVQKMVYIWIKKHIYECDDPRSYGKPLENNLYGYWRYRIGDYRLIVKIKEFSYGGTARFKLIHSPVSGISLSTISNAYFVF